MNSYWKRLSAYLSLTLGLWLTIPALATDITIKLQNQQKQALADAVLYLVSPSGPLESPTITHQIEQVNKQFVPLVSAVPVNSVVEFPNHDHVKHHVYSFSTPKTFEIRLYKGADSPPVTMDKPGIVTLGCNIHDFMVGYIYILDTPYYGVSNKDGIVNIQNVASGTYTLKAWHPGIQQGREIDLETLKIGDNTTLTRQHQLSIKPEAYWKPQAGESDEYGF